MEYFLLLDRHLPEGVGIDMFGVSHIVWLAASVLICALLCVIYRRKDTAGRHKMGLTIMGTIVFLETFRIAAQIISGVFRAEYLPLHLCNFAVYFIIIHSFRGGKLLGDVLYGLCMPSAVCALLFPDWVRYPLLNIQSIQAFLIHTFLVAYPIMCVAGGDIVPRAKRLPKVALLVAGIAVPLYFLNKLIDTNFFFLNWPSPGSPLELFGDLLGIPWYILGIIPLLLVIWVFLYLPIELVRVMKKRKSL